MPEYYEDSEDRSAQANRLAERLERITKLQMQSFEMIDMLEAKIDPVLSSEVNEKAVAMNEKIGADLHPAPTSSLAGSLEDIIKQQQRVLRRLGTVVERIDL